MPVYVYKCNNGHKHEVMQLITDKPVDKCPVYFVPKPTDNRMDEVIVCNAPVQRIIQKTSFIIK